MRELKNNSFSTFAKFSEKHPLIHTPYVCIRQEVRNASFSENFVNVLNEWSIKDVWKCSYYKHFSKKRLKAAATDKKNILQEVNSLEV